MRFFCPLIDRKEADMKVSINTAVFLDHLNNGMSQLESLKILDGLENEIDNIQVRGEFFDDKTKDQEIENIKKACQNNGWGLYYSVPEELFNKGKINSSIDSNIKMAKKHDLKYLKYFIGDVKNVDPKEIAALDQKLADAGIELTLENLSNDSGRLEKVEEGLEAIKNSKNIGYTYDAGNWYWVDENPFVAFKKLKNQITNYHLKDIKDKETVMLGEGDTDWQPMVLSLSDNIPIFLEYGIPDEQIKHEVELVNSVINKR